MTEVKTKQSNSQQIKPTDDGVGESNDHHPVDIRLTMRIAESAKILASQVDGLHENGVVKEGVNDKGCNNRTAVNHGAGG